MLKALRNLNQPTNKAIKT